MEIGYTLMGEQRSPKDLVRDAQLAEQAGFDFMVASDHYFPWLEAQGHSPYTWTVLGAVAQATERIPFMTYVTCPIVRYHPAVVAQKAATVQVMADGRFILGLGSGENLNEHVVGARGGDGDRRPAAARRHLRERAGGGPCPRGPAGPRAARAGARDGGRPEPVGRAGSGHAPGRRRDRAPGGAPGALTGRDGASRP